MKKLALLGSTGSIGTQTVEVAREKNINITALAAYSNIKLLEDQIREFSPRLVAVVNEEAGKELRIKVSDTDTKVLIGEDAVTTVAEESDADILLNSLMGRCGIRPTVAAIRSGKNIAMANKEPLVAAGDIILDEVKRAGVRLLPVDSEHSAIFQCLDSEHNSKKFIKRLIITASGGPFFGRTRAELEKVTLADALKHPTWSMGAKITVDSASLMNKGLEVIEAVRLFGVPAEKIDVTVHRQSIVHSMVEFVDSSILAQMGNPNMKHCIAFALTYPERQSSLCTPLDFTKAFSLTFDTPDEDTFTLLPLARRAVTMGGNAPAVMNSANEEAVSLFLKEKIRFTDIFTLVEEAVNTLPHQSTVTLDSLEEDDVLAREFVNRTAKSIIH
ncbi:MAG: 1-deoxy-D-xylulose-5-phosphate reductoisomerase [Ruminococcaceae bacterium]|nr:1-deoxy-D-xylulose-5-phosphate reductoisomerase [Oscillospiraceae bacterium]